MIPHPTLNIRCRCQRHPVTLLHTKPSIVPVLMRAVVEALSAGEPNPVTTHPGDVVANRSSVQEAARTALHLGSIVFRGSCSTYAQGLFDWFTELALNVLLKPDFCCVPRCSAFLLLTSRIHDNSRVLPAMGARPIATV
jgi:hypothetical protein